VERRQLEQPGTPHVCQHKARDLLSFVVVPRHGSRGWAMKSCTLMNPLEAQAVCRLGLLPGCRDEDVLDKFSR
jgi:hypothetical protein